jgi:hypothetical protein
MTSNTQIHDRSLSWLNTSTSIKGGGGKLVLWAKISLLSEMIRSCTYFPHVMNMLTLTYIRRRKTALAIRFLITVDYCFNIMSYDGLVYYLIMVGVIGCDNFCVTKMEYIMYIMFKIIVFFLITLFFRIYVSVNIFLTCGKYVHDRIISLRREILAHKTSLN